MELHHSVVAANERLSTTEVTAAQVNGFDETLVELEEVLSTDDRLLDSLTDDVLAKFSLLGELYVHDFFPSHSQRLLTIFERLTKFFLGE